MTNKHHAVLKEALTFLTAFAVILALTTLPGIFSGMYVSMEALGIALLISAGSALYIYLGIVLHRRLAKVLGPYTAVVALILIAEVATFSVALMLPYCPGLTILNAADRATRCTPYEAANWAFAMAALVILFGLTHFMGSQFIRGAKVIFNAYKELWTTHRNKKAALKQEELAQQEAVELAEAKVAAKTRDPQDKKGYATPARKVKRNPNRRKKNK